MRFFEVMKMSDEEKCVHDGVQDVHDWLMQLRMLDELIDAKQAEKEQLMTMATHITPEMSGMPGAGGVSDKVGSTAGKLVDLAKEIDSLVDSYVDRKAQVVAVLKKLPPKEFGVLHRHYVRYMTLGQIAEDMNYCYMQVWRIKQNGLKNLHDVMECYTIPVV
jgi:hypothetical protein